MNDLLPPYFNYMKPNVPVICDHNRVRNPNFHLPVIVVREKYTLQIYICIINII